jgi:transposase
MERIDALYLEDPCSGSRRMVGYLARDGIPISRDRVRNLMRRMGLRAIYQKPRTTVPGDPSERFPCLVDLNVVTAVDQVWATDITYIPMQKGFLYLVAIVDLFSRNVLSWKLSNSLDTEFCLDCQATAKTEPEATRKLSHPAVETTSTISGPTTGMGMGVAESPSAHTAGLTSGLEGVMQTPGEVTVMRQLLERGWSQRRIARELGISRHTVSRYLALGTWQPYDSSNRVSQLDGCKAWLQQQFEQHHGNAEVVRQELLKQKGIRVSLRTVERAVQAWRESLRQSRQATVRYETRPGQQLQADFGELWMLIGGVRTKVHLCVLTLGYSRRQVVRVFRHQRQQHWLQALEEAFRIWVGVPEQVLVDNANALVTLNNPRTGELVINPTFAAFARHWGFTPKACWPHRPQTKGKDERGVGYVKRSGMAGHRFDTWGQREGHLEWWNREIADVRIHGTTGE